MMVCRMAWGCGLDLNQRPLAEEASALPTELPQRIVPYIGRKTPNDFKCPIILANGVHPSSDSHVIKIANLINFTNHHVLLQKSQKSAYSRCMRLSMHLLGIWCKICVSVFGLIIPVVLILYASIVKLCCNFKCDRTSAGIDKNRTTCFSNSGS